MIIITLWGPDVWDGIQVATAHDQKEAEEIGLEMVKKYVEPMKRYGFLDYQMIKKHFEHIESFLLDFWAPGLPGERWERLP